MYEYARETHTHASYLTFKHYFMHVFHVHNTYITIASINFCRKFDSIKAEIGDFPIYRQHYSSQPVIVNRNIMFIH